MKVSFVCSILMDSYDDQWKFRLYSAYKLIIKMINGSLVGMVSICAGADRYYPWAVCVIAGIL